MIRWFLATLHLSHLQADDNYACHLLTAKIFQIGLSKNVVHIWPLCWEKICSNAVELVFTHNFQVLFAKWGPTKSGTMWRPAMMLPPPGWVVLPPAAPWNLGKGDIWTMKNLEIWWWFWSKIWSFIYHMEGSDPRELGFKIEKLVEVTK